MKLADTPSFRIKSNKQFGGHHNHLMTSESEQDPNAMAAAMSMKKISNNFI